MRTSFPMLSCPGRHYAVREYAEREMFDIRETSLLRHVNQMRHSPVDEHGLQVRAVACICSPLSSMTLTTHSSLFSLIALNCLLTLPIVQRTDGDDDENCDKDNNALDPIYWGFSFEAGLTEVR